MKTILTALVLSAAAFAATPASAITITGTTASGGNAVSPVELTGSQISIDFDFTTFAPTTVDFLLGAGDAAVFNFDSFVDFFTGVNPDLAQGAQVLTFTLTGGALFGPAGTVSPNFSTASTTLTANQLLVSFTPRETDGVLIGSLDDTIGDFAIDRSALAAGSGFSLIVGASPIPEPATWAMMIAGFGLVGAAIRRRGAVAGLAA